MWLSVVCQNEAALLHSSCHLACYNKQAGETNIPSRYWHLFWLKWFWGWKSLAYGIVNFYSKTSAIRVPLDVILLCTRTGRRTQKRIPRVICGVGLGQIWLAWINIQCCNMANLWLLITHSQCLYERGWANLVSIAGNSENMCCSPKHASWIVYQYSSS